MKLVIVHYHLRPGGVRRIIELAAPHLVRTSQRRVTGVILASGEPPDRKWLENFKRLLGRTPVELFVEPAFSYFSEQRQSVSNLRRRIDRGLLRLLGGGRGEELIVWAHNLGLARNLLLTQQLSNHCQAHGVRLMAHHHDWWFDNRWQRWPECRRAGFRSLKSVAEAVFDSNHTHHFTINHADAAVLERHAHGQVTWLPNLAEPEPPPARKKVRAAREWLSRRLGTEAPVWLLPCRFLRRKNVAEALLLTRWLRPEAWLVTTGGVSSSDEQPYFDQFNAAAHAHHWRLRLGVLAGDEARKPAMPELLAASEAVMLTSIQEGFGLPYLEAAATRRPLIARALPNIAPDLAQFGFRFPQGYGEILISTALFDWRAERVRQRNLFRRWTRDMPAAVHRLAQEPPLTARQRPPAAVPFSRLTLTTQIEILAQPVARSWDFCAPLNPFLATWRRRAARGALQVSPWPRRAVHWLAGASYGRKFWSAVAAENRRSGIHPEKCQADFIRHKLHPEYLYPLLWSCDS